MIITHTVSASGHRRVYLGGKASLECWIEPADDGVAWSFHVDPNSANYGLDEKQRREWAAYVLTKLARELKVKPNELERVPFDRIAALHVGSQADCTRVSAPRCKAVEHGYVATAPKVTHPFSGTGLVEQIGVADLVTLHIALHSP